MARKKKKQLSPIDQLTIAQRELDKGNAKQAVKFAKTCYRKDPSEPARILLQRALLSRGRELHARSMLDPARATIVELDDLGEVAAEYQGDVVRLRALLKVDDTSCDAELLENDRQLRDELADHAVLQGPDSSGRSEFRETAKAIHEALSALEANQSERAVELLASIGRDSPFADWKLLIRGLSAYYQGDKQRMVANWSRLTNDRPARRIADALSVLAGTQQSDDTGGVLAARVDRLVHAIETPLLRGLRALQKKMQDPDVKGPALRAALRKFMNAHAQSEPKVAERVGQLIVNWFIREKEVAELFTFQQALPRLPLDPHLNRAAALMSEGARDLDQIEWYWKAYIKDLRFCEVLTESQRATAVALVYQRVATHLFAAAREAENWPSFRREDDDGEYGDLLYREAESYLRKSLDADPNLRDTYLALGGLLRLKGKENDAAATYKELGRRFPDDFEVMTEITRHFIAAREPGVAKTYASKARALRPRDSAALNLVWSSCIATAREAAKLRQFGLAETELDEAETLIESDERNAYLLYSVRAAVAFKENRYESGEAFLQQTIQQFEKPTAALLLVQSQTLRCGVTNREIREDLKRRLDKALKGRKNAEAAGVMANYLYALEMTGVEYAGLATHLKQVAKYLNECSRVKWRPEHLVDACRFAGMEQEHQSLLEKLAKRGRKLFGKNPYFYFFGGQAEMMCGPHEVNHYIATDHFERAIELSKTGDIPLINEDLQATSRALSLLERSHSLRSPVFGPWDYEDDSDEPEDGFDLSQVSIEDLMANLPPELKRKLQEVGLDEKAAAEHLAEMLGMKFN